MEEFVSFSIADIPGYLQNSEFFESLEKNQEQLTLAKIHYKPNLYVKSLTDMRHLLSTMRFWGVKSIPRELVMYVANNPEMNLQATLAEFTNELRCVAFLEVLGRDLQNIIPSTYNQAIIGSYMRADGSMVERLISLLSVQFANHRGQIWDEETSALAAQQGWLDCLTFLHENGCAWNTTTCTNAAGRGCIECLKYAHSNGCLWDASTTAVALRYGRTECFQYARSHRCPWDASICSTAALRGELTLLRFAHESGCPWDATTCENAVIANNLACLMYAREHGCPWDSHTCTSAAARGRMEMLIYAHENGCPWDAKTCAMAAAGSQLACLHYAHTQGCPWDEGTCIQAACVNSLDCLQYARLEGCPWTEKLYKYAANANGTDCLRFAIVHGCPGWRNACQYATYNVTNLRFLKEEMQCNWGEDVINACATLTGVGTACLQYCLTNACPFSATTAMLAANDVEKLKLLHRYNCLFDQRALHVAARNVNLESLDYLLTHGCPGKIDLVKHVAHHLPMLHCAHRHGCELTPTAYWYALNGDCPLQVVKFLFQNGCPWPREACTWFAQAPRLPCWLLTMWRN